MTEDDMQALLNMTDSECADVLERTTIILGGRGCGKTALRNAYMVAITRAIAKLREEK